MKKKIILFSNTSWFFLKFRKNLLRELIKKNYDIYILSSKDGSTNKLKKMGCNFNEIIINRKSTNLLTNFILIIKIYLIYKKIKPDVVCHSTIKPVIFGSIISSFLKIPTINNITGLGTAYMKRNLLTYIINTLYKFSQKNVHTIFFENNDDKNFFDGKKLSSNSNNEVIPGSGVDLEYYKSSKYPNEQKKITFILPARLIYDKGINEYIEAIKILKNQYDELIFNILGPFDFNNKSAISKNNIKEWESLGLINYLGFAEDIREYIENSHCVVLPSYLEGMPNSLLEAASMSRPIITTNTSGCKDVVVEDYNGYLCKVKNPSDLAYKISKFIELKHEEKILMGKNSRQLVEKKFSDKIVIANYLNSISKIS